MVERRGKPSPSTPLISSFSVTLDEFIKPRQHCQGTTRHCTTRMYIPNACSGTVKFCSSTVSRATKPDATAQKQQSVCYPPFGIPKFVENAALTAGNINIGDVALHSGVSMLLVLLSFSIFAQERRGYECRTCQVTLRAKAAILSLAFSACPFGQASP